MFTSECTGCLGLGLSLGCCSKLMMSLRGSHIYYRVKMEEREILGKVRCSQESPEVV